MKLHHSSPSGLKIFTACGSGYVEVNGTHYERPIVVTPERVLDDWPPQSFEALSESHFDYLVAVLPEIILLGTGSHQRFPHPRLYHKLTDAGIAVEPMNTAAACRTYNILASEGRKVLAAILL